MQPTQEQSNPQVISWLLPAACVSVIGGLALVAAIALPTLSYPPTTKPVASTPTIRQVNHRSFLQRHTVSRSVTLFRLGIKNRKSLTPVKMQPAPPYSATQVAYTNQHNYIHAMSMIASTLNLPFLPAVFDTPRTNKNAATLPNAQNKPL